MSINVDFSTAQTVSDLKGKATQLTQQISAEATSLEDSAKSIVDVSIANCSVFGSMQALVKDAVADLSKGIKSATASIQESITSLMKRISEIVSTIKDKFKAIADAITGILDKLDDTMTAIIESFKSIMSGLKSSLNSVISDIMASVAFIGDFAKDIFSKFADGLKKIFAVNCNTVATAIKDFPSGVSNQIDSLTQTVKDSSANVIGNAMSGVTQSFDKFLNMVPSFNDALGSAATAVTGIDDIIADINALA